MWVLIVTRRGVTIGVFTSEAGATNRLKRKAEQIDGAVLSWHNFISHLGAHSNHDDERTYEIHKAEPVSL